MNYALDREKNNNKQYTTKYKVNCRFQLVNLFYENLELPKYRND